MKKIENKEAHIRELYEIDGVVKGSMFSKERKISAFEIGEICLLQQDKDIENVIKNAYMACIRGINVDYQILVKTSRIDMGDYINEVSKKQIKILNDELKMASKRYIEYLKNIWKEKEIYITKYYFLASNLSEKEELEIEGAFKNMKDLGISINKIIDNNKSCDLINSCINQG